MGMGEKGMGVGMGGGTGVDGDGGRVMAWKWGNSCEDGEVWGSWDGG